MSYVGENVIKKMSIDNNDLGFEINNISNHAKGYHKKSSFTNLLLGFFLDKSKFMGKAEGKWMPFNNFYVNGISYGGLIGKPSAFVKYIQVLMRPNNEVISDDLKTILFQENFTNKKQSTGMCLSWFKGNLNGHTYYTHAGGGGGYYCEIRIYPKNHLGSVVFFNRTGMRDERFLDKVDEIYFR
jgi:D-alanyl-D-alanine carboxypeptidase